MEPQGTSTSTVRVQSIGGPPAVVARRKGTGDPPPSPIRKRIKAGEDRLRGLEETGFLSDPSPSLDTEMEAEEMPLFRIWRLLLFQPKYQERPVRRPGCVC
ncbi:hypothetical protein Bbelb_198450 [Branchiostoma belcheri]|nr:hypothetical protein Bbelb_198450 [Branchiostoma belcheri]